CGGLSPLGGQEGGRGLGCGGGRPPISASLGPHPTSPASTSPAAPAISRLNSKPSPASTSSFVMAKRPSPTASPKPQHAQPNPAPPGAFGLPTHHPIFGSDPHMSSISRRPSVLFGPGRFGRMRRSPSRRGSSSHPSGRA